MIAGYFFSEEKDTELMKLWKEFCNLPDGGKWDFLNGLPKDTLRDLIILVKRNEEKTYLLSQILGYHTAIGTFLENFWTKEADINFVMQLMREHERLMNNDKEREALSPLETLLDNISSHSSFEMIYKIKLDDIGN